MKLVLEITFGNDAMLGPEDAARELRHVAGQLEEGTTDGVVFDGNGNRVGRWEVRPDGD